MDDEPLKIYYRVWLIVILITHFPVSLILSYRAYKIFLKSEPAIHPGCTNIFLKLGIFILKVSKFFVVLGLFGIVVTFILALSLTSPGGISAVPAGMILGISMLFVYIAIPFIELSQIGHRKNQSIISTNSR